MVRGVDKFEGEKIIDFEGGEYICWEVQKNLN